MVRNRNDKQRPRQKSAEGIVGHVVGKASEALHAERRRQQIGRTETMAEGPNERRGK
jgi:hypothetical protein